VGSQRAQAQVRPRKEEDLAALVAILEETHVTDGYPMWEEHASGDWLFDPGFETAWVALAGDAVVGHIAVKRGFDSAAIERELGRRAADILGITRLFVGSGARGLGAASALMDVVDTYAASLGLGLALEVVDGSTSAIALYERRGWRRVATESATWFAPDGSNPTVHLYVAPSGSCG
jgi:ribosomal-protein-alanine N-acetyltransferase